jgi:DNA-binding transcriptional regulator YdaS (Cro superfamily)
MAYPVFKNLLKERGITQAALARMLGVNKSSVTLWSLGEVPAKRAIEIERATGIPRSKLRPDLWSPSIGRTTQPEAQPEAAE